jgi:hypothetical protein
MLDLIMLRLLLNNQKIASSDLGKTGHTNYNSKSLLCRQIPCLLTITYSLISYLLFLQSDWSVAVKGKQLVVSGQKKQLLGEN